MEGWNGLKGVVYNVKPATLEMKTLIEVDKFLREEILIPGAEAAKEVNEKMMKKKKKMMTMKAMIVIVEEDEKKEDENEEEKEDEKKEDENEEEK